MAFPTTSVLDNFDRANDATPPPGANWSTIYNGHDIYSNTLRGHASADANVSQWVGATYGPSIEAYITLGADVSEFCLYILDSSFDHGYSVDYVSDGGTWKIGIYREDTAGSDSTLLGSLVSADLSTGHKLGIYYDAASDTIYAYKDIGLGWVEVTHQTNSTYTDLDTLGIFSYSTMAFDNFGGGSVVSAATLTVADIAHANALDAAGKLTKRSTLAVADGAHAQALDALDLSGAAALGVADSAHAHALEAVGLSQVHNLTVADVAHAHALDALSLGGTFTLVVAEIAHGHALEAISRDLRYIVCQNFEGTGFDNGETWLTLEGDTGDIDPDYTTGPLRGSQSLHVTDDDTEGTYATTKFSTDTGVNALYGFFRIKFASYPSGPLGDYEFFQTYNCQGALVAVPDFLESHEMLFINDGILYVNHGDGGAELGHGTHEVELNTVHYVWFYFSRSADEKSTGWVKVSHTQAIPGTNDIAWTNSSIAGQSTYRGTNACGFTTYHGSGIEYLADQLIIDDQAINNSPFDTIDLVLADSAHANVLDALVLGQLHNLAVVEISHTQALEAVALSQVHNLVVADLAHAHALEAVALSQVHNLVVADLAHAHALEAVSLSKQSTLAVAEIAHAHALEAAALSQVHNLAVADSAHGHSLEAVVLGQLHNLIPADAAHGHSLEAINLAGMVTLALADIAHAQALEAVALGQLHNLAVVEISHTQALEAVVVSQAHLLALVEIGHANSLEAAGVLVQAHVLAPAEIAHGHALDSLALVYTPIGTLVVAEVSHGHSLESPVLSQVHHLSLVDAAHAHTLDPATLAQIYNLVVADLAHAHSLDPLTLARLFNLAVAEIGHANTLDALALSQLHNLLPAEIAHSQALDSLALVEVGPDSLAVADIAHGHALEGLTLVDLIVLAARVFAIAAEDRNWAIAAENRAWAVAEEDRVYGVPS